MSDYISPPFKLFGDPILDKTDHGHRLGEEAAAADKLQALLRPFPAERMKAYRIRSTVGNVRKNDNASLIEPLPGGVLA